MNFKTTFRKCFWHMMKILIGPYFLLDFSEEQVSQFESYDPERKCLNV